MKIDELTPEAISILKSLVSNPHAIEDSTTLQLLLADRMVMGSPAKIHITQSGRVLIAQYIALIELSPSEAGAN